MMQALGRYILSVTASALALGIFNCIFNKNNTVGALIRLMGGIWMIFVVVSPVERVDLEMVLDAIGNVNVISQKPLEDGSREAEKAFRGIISEQTQAYIMDKASQLNLQVDVAVQLSDEDPPIPISIQIRYQGDQSRISDLSNIIAEELGIPREDQEWIRQN